MDTFYFDLRQSRGFAAVCIRRMVLGPIAWIVYLAVAFAVTRHMTFHSEWEPFAVAVFLAAYATHIVHDFLREKLEADVACANEGPNLADILSYDVLRNLPRRTAPTTLDTVRAAVSSPRAAFVLHAMNTTSQEFLAACTAEPLQVPLLAFLQDASGTRSRFGEQHISAPLLIYAFLRQEPAGERFRNACDLSLEDIAHIVLWESDRYRKRNAAGRWSPAGLARTWGAWSRTWVTGYNDTLETLTDDLSAHVRMQPARSVVLHTDTLQTMHEILDRANRRNIALVGRTGTGRSTLVENLAEMLRKQETMHHGTLSAFRSLHVQQLLSATANPDAVLLKTLTQASHEPARTVVVVHDAVLLLRTADARLRSVLSKFFHASNIAFIFLFTSREYHDALAADPTLEALFETVQIDDVSEEETLRVLMEESIALERRFSVQIAYQDLRTIVALSSRYIGGHGMPGKAVDVLRDAVTAARASGRKLTEEHVRHIVSQKAHMNVEAVSQNERETLLHLEEILHRRIVGQDRACAALVSALKRARADLSGKHRPLGTFLFIGPTGVGKTETAKVLAKEYFGSVDSFLRVDLNEYATADSISGLIGTAGGGAFREGMLARRVQDRPFSLVLLDEIEKAHPTVLNVFLQILDEGMLIDPQGARIDFRNTIIIATSNAGAQDSQEGKQWDTLPPESRKKMYIDTLVRSHVFTPEFLNRFDDIVLFEPLTPQQAQRVAVLMIDAIVRDVYDQRGIRLTIDEDAVHAIVERGYSRSFGAREMRRAITQAIETHLATVLLERDVHRGDGVHISRSDIEPKT